VGTVLDAVRLLWQTQQFKLGVGLGFQEGKEEQVRTNDIII